MKPLTVAISIAVLALPLCASEAADQTKKNTTSTTLSATAAAQQQDSPLVRAAKATGRLNKKPTMVITNDTLVKTGGHFTTTTLNTPLPSAPAQPESNDLEKARAAQRERLAAEQKAKADAAAAKKEQALRRAAADYNGESVEPRSDDPAVQEHQMQQMTSTQPPAKPPKN